MAQRQHGPANSRNEHIIIVRIFAVPNLEVALRYAQAGMPIFPCGHDKSPLVSSWPTDATTDEGKVRGWWTANPDAIVGLPLEPLDLVVFDADRHGNGHDGVAEFQKVANGQLPEHPVVLTANGGEHHVFRQSEAKIRNRQLGNGLETRGFGGYVIACGSRLPDSRAWRLGNGSPSVIGAYKAGTIPLVPAHLADLTRPKTSASESQQQQSTGHAGRREQAYAAKALDNLAHDLADTGVGNRNNSLNVAALKIGGMIARDWIGRATVEGRLHDACVSNGLVRDDGAHSVRSTLKSGIEAGLKSPHDDLPDREPPPQKSQQPEPKPAAHDWGDPDWSVLDDRRGELPEFPTDAFTPPIREWLERAAHGAGVHPDHVAVPLLGVASSLIGTARRVRASRSWSEPTTLWTTIVANSGDRKTPGLNVIRRALDQIERDQAAAVASARLAHETRAQKSKEAAKKWKEERAAALEGKPPREPPTMPLEALDPGEFIEPRLYATDPTIERLAALLRVRPRGMMLIRDELAGLFANMGRYSGGSDRPFWLEAWVGGRHVVERVSGAVVVDHLLVGVIGGFQPDKLARAFAGDEDGMSGRFLFGWPSVPGYRPLTDEVAEVEPEIQSALTALIRLPAEDADGTFAVQERPLSAEARGAFEQYRKLVDQAKHALDGIERQWLAKSETQVLRLAATLCYLDWAFSLGKPGTNGVALVTARLEPPEIGAAFMDGAIKLVRQYFWLHARAALRQIGITDRHRNARRVLRWIKANGKDGVSREEVRRDALGQCLDAEQTQALLDGLVKTGWLAKATTETKGRARHRWKVNPKLFLDGLAGSAESAESPI